MSDKRLIMIICNNGYAEEIMDVAKQAGARGGTIMRGRSSAIHEETKFFGITIHPEKDVLMIVVKNDACNEIMQAVNQKHGVGTKAHALSFTLAIEDTIGFNL